jgi:hypothetical protein
MIFRKENPNMRGRSVLGTAVLFLLAAAAPASAQIVIDDFATAQGTITATDPGTLTTKTSVASGSAIGGGRALQVSTNSGGGGSMTAQVSSGALSFTRTTAPGEVDVWWDGNADTTFGFGLAANLTAGGQDRFRVTVTSSSSASPQMSLIAWTDGTNFSTMNFTLPTGGGTIDLPYASFTPTNAGATWTNVNNIYLSTVAVAGTFSGVISDLRTAPVELTRFAVD